MSSSYVEGLKLLDPRYAVRRQEDAVFIRGLRRYHRPLYVMFQRKRREITDFLLRGEPGGLAFLLDNASRPVFDDAQHRS